MNHKSFFNELKSLKSFMNDKEEIVTKINEDIAAEFKIIYSIKFQLFTYIENAKISWEISKSSLKKTSEMSKTVAFLINWMSM